jgi:DNA-binding transcriptional LysR family regulator
MRGTALLAIAPSMLDDGLMRGLAWVAPPFEVPTLKIHMSWHRRNETDVAHQWLRELIRDSAAALQRCLAAGGGLAHCAATVNT